MFEAALGVEYSCLQSLAEEFGEELNYLKVLNAMRKDGERIAAWHYNLTILKYLVKHKSQKSWSSSACEVAAEQGHFRSGWSATWICHFSAMQRHAGEI